MLVLKSLWLWIHSVLWPSMSYEAVPDLNLTSHFQVIGTGLSRTGTFSTRIALTKLLGGKCYHGYVASLDGEPEFWQKASNGQLSEQDWVQGLEGRGYTAGVGEPINLFYPELMKIFPKSKVILTVRPVDDWVRSMRRAIIEPRSYLEEPPISWVFSLLGIAQAKESLNDVRKRMADKWGFEHNLWSAVEAGDETAREYFESWNAQVIASVPKDRLLIYNVEDGWEPLVQFLNVTMPQEAFPKINDADTVRLVIRLGYWIVVLFVPIIILLCTCKIRRRLLERTFLKIMSLVRQLKDHIGNSRQKTMHKYQPVANA